MQDQLHSFEPEESFEQQKLPGISAESVENCKSGLGSEPQPTTTPPMQPTSTKTSAAHPATLATQRLLLGSMLALSLGMLWLTRESSPGEPATLAFTDETSSSAGTIAILAMCIWFAGATAVHRFSADLAPGDDHDNS